MSNKSRIFSLILLFSQVAFAQLKFYESQFKGGVTGAGYSPLYSTGGSGSFTLNIPAGSTIHKAYFFATRYGQASALTVSLNANSLVFDATTNQVTPTFQTNYGLGGGVHAIDVTALLNPSTLTYTVTVPSQFGPTDRFNDFYLYVTYDNATLSQVTSAVFLDTLNTIDSVSFNINPTNPVSNAGDIGVAVLGSYICDNMSDGENVYVNTSYLGKIGGANSNSGYCGGPVGDFYYYNCTLNGLLDGKPDLAVGGADALSNVKTKVSTPGFKMNFVKTPGAPATSSADNLVWGVIVNYSASCSVNSPLVTAVADTICPGSCTTLTATGSSGKAPYTYSWSNGSTGTTANVCPLTTTTYTITITDATAATGTTTVQVKVDQVINVIAGQFTAATCSNANGVATVKALGGTGTLTYSWAMGANGQTANGLLAGDYIVTVTDAVSCTVSSTATIQDKGVPIVGLQNVTNGCAGQTTGSMMVTVVGGTPVYTYLWSNGGTHATITNLSVGDYTVTVTDANGCTATTNSSISSFGQPVINITPALQTIEEGSSVAITVSGAVTYTWSPATGLSCDNCSNPVATPSVTTTYSIVATDVNGCTVTALMTITVRKGCVGNDDELFVPNIFSPNNDGKNDVLFLEGNGLSNIYWAIYDRWGNLLFEAFDKTHGWDGTLKGSPMETGTYVYYVKATCIKTNTEVKLKGNVTLVK